MTCCFWCSPLRLHRCGCLYLISSVQSSFQVFIGSVVPDTTFVKVASVQSIPVILALPAASSLTVPPHQPHMSLPHLAFHTYRFVYQIVMFDLDAPSPSLLARGRHCTAHPTLHRTVAQNFAHCRIPLSTTRRQDLLQKIINKMKMRLPKKSLKYQLPKYKNTRYF
jgi:hypothetical protein